MAINCQSKLPINPGAVHKLAPTAPGRIIGNLGNQKMDCQCCQDCQWHFGLFGQSVFQLPRLPMLLAVSLRLPGGGGEWALFENGPRPGPTHRRVWAGGFTKILIFILKPLKTHPAKKLFFIFKIQLQKVLQSCALASLALLVIDFLSAALKLHT